ncbi:hypothetical protein HPB52_022742 [Rhipicephalus sanguineus]|uniref:Uncharacterized protein n=1 Tax=Rhipicephalus sanguineus TaxID=34632 RepID=A0A9D4QEB4_RHISA|nr:hypothetical protein HPB52_022742 [Rhipicephalus sanguineus]
MDKTMRLKEVLQSAVEQTLKRFLKVSADTDGPLLRGGEGARDTVDGLVGARVVNGNLRTQQQCGILKLFQSTDCPQRIGMLYQMYRLGIQISQVTESPAYNPRQPVLSAVVPAPDDPPDDVQDPTPEVAAPDDVAAAIDQSATRCVSSTPLADGPSGMPAIRPSSLTSPAHDTSLTSPSTLATLPPDLEADTDNLSPALRPSLAEVSPSTVPEHDLSPSSKLCASCQQRPASPLTATAADVRAPYQLRPHLQDAVRAPLPDPLGPLPRRLSRASHRDHHGLRLSQVNRTPLHRPRYPPKTRHFQSRPLMLTILEATPPRGRSLLWTWPALHFIYHRGLPLQ